ncbi:MAG: RNA polymerase sigma factor [Oscillospiraceae bacterium]|nr:RNA polymerase sigma factor [Oscillospiraceae bacterium]
METAIFTDLYEKTMPSVYRLCFSYMKNRADTQDMVHNVYLKLLQSGKAFESDEHRKAWLIVTARNLCKNTLRHWWRRNAPLDDADAGIVRYETAYYSIAELGGKGGRELSATIEDPIIGRKANASGDIKAERLVCGTYKAGSVSGMVTIGEVSRPTE